MDSGAEPAENDYLRSLAAWQRAEPGDPEQTSVLLGLEEVYGHTGQWTKAERFGRQALALRAGPGELQSLAAILQGENRYPEAWELYQRAFRFAKPAESDTVMAQAYSNFGVLLYQMGHSQQAIEEVQRAIALWNAAPMPNHLPLALGLTNLAGLYCRERRWSEAGEPLRRAREIVIAESGAQHPMLSSILRAQAEVLRHTGKGREARVVEKQADELLHRAGRENAMGYTVDVNSLR